MHAARRVPHIVSEIDLHRLPEIAFGQRHVAETRRDGCVDRRAERTPMTAAGLIIAEIGLPDRRRKSIPQKVQQHHDVGLLDDLRALDALAAKQHVHRRVARLESSEIDLLQVEIALELFDQPRPLVQSGIEVACHAPAIRRARPAARPSRSDKRPPPLRPSLGDTVARRARRPRGSTAPSRWCRRCRPRSRGTHRDR